MTHDVAKDNRVPARASGAQRHFEELSRLVLGVFEGPRGDLDSRSDLKYVAGLNAGGRSEFLELARSHHVIVRALAVLEKTAALEDGAKQWWREALQAERKRTAYAVEVLASICAALEAENCKVAVIKSLDHWPDLGSDLDLFTTGHEGRVKAVMWKQFSAAPVRRSWGDRLAHKWNFSLPGLPELVEIHVRYLGQTGEQKKMARRVIERRTPTRVGGHTFLVPEVEERIMISTLQRMYRHFYFRLCDIADLALLLKSRRVDFAELRRAADEAGIWPGVATFLFLVSAHLERYGGPKLPPQVLESVYSPHPNLRLENGFLRVPKLPAVGLFASQFVSAGMHRDLRAICRLPLLPPLAVSALLSQRLTGSDKGVW
jgi:hypothetical protein